MPDDQSPMPEEARGWVRHPVPPEMIAEILAEYDKPETIAEIQDVIDGKVKMFTIDEVLAEMWAAAGQPPPS
jgi:hypothetical protein